jgi:thiol-disulfide isomerase/thioredoxin
MKYIIFILLALFCMGCGSSRSMEFDPLAKAVPLDQYTGKTDLSRTVKPGFPFDINLMTANNMVANSADVFGHYDKPVVLSFWLTTCAPCLREFQEMSEKYPAWKNYFRFVGISTDFEQNMPRVWEINKERQFPFEIYWDMHREFRKVLPGALNGLPQVFVFDKNGQIAYHKKGFFTGDAEKLYEKTKEIAAASK